MVEIYLMPIYFIGIILLAIGNLFIRLIFGIYIMDKAEYDLVFEDNKKTVILLSTLIYFLIIWALK